MRSLPPMPPHDLPICTPRRVCQLQPWKGQGAPPTHCCTVCVPSLPPTSHTPAPHTACHATASPVTGCTAAVAPGHDPHWPVQRGRGGLAEMLWLIDIPSSIRQPYARTLLASLTHPPACLPWLPAPRPERGLAPAPWREACRLLPVAHGRMCGSEEVWDGGSVG